MYNHLLRRFLAIQVIASSLCYLAQLIEKFVLRMPETYLWPFNVKSPIVPDFDVLTRLFDHYHTAQFFHPDNAYPFMYPPLCGLLYEAFQPIKPVHIREVVFAFSIVATFLVIVLAYGLAWRQRGLTVHRSLVLVVVTTLLSYPLSICFVRGNIEIYVWAICITGVWAAYRDRGYTAAACFAIATSLKLYPVVYFGLLLSRRQWKQILLGAAIAMGTTCIALWMTFPVISVSARQTLTGISTFNNFYAGHVEPQALQIDHSLFSLYKRVFTTPTSSLHPALTVYTIVAVFVGAATFLRTLTVPLTRQVAALTLSMILLPQVSFDYTLLHLYTVVGLIVWTGRESVDASERLLLFLLAVAVSPLTEFYFGHFMLEGQLKASLLLLALLCSCWRSSTSSDQERTTSVGEFSETSPHAGAT